MIKVTVGNNVKKEHTLVDADTTLRSVLEGAGINCMRGSTHLDGTPLAASDFDKTFRDFGITESCFLLNVAKADNG